MLKINYKHKKTFAFAKAENIRGSKFEIIFEINLVFQLTVKPGQIVLVLKY